MENRKVSVASRPDKAPVIVKPGDFEPPAAIGPTVEDDPPTNSSSKHKGAGVRRGGGKRPVKK